MIARWRPTPATVKNPSLGSGLQARENRRTPNFRTLLILTMAAATSGFIDRIGSDSSVPPADLAPLSQPTRSRRCHGTVASSTAE
jgi:hypothetical protein